MLVFGVTPKLRNSASDQTMRNVTMKNLDTNFDLLFCVLALEVNANTNKTDFFVASSTGLLLSVAS